MIFNEAPLRVTGRTADAKKIKADFALWKARTTSAFYVCAGTITRDGEDFSLAHQVFLIVQEISGYPIRPIFKNSRALDAKFPHHESEKEHFGTICNKHMPARY